MSKITFRADDDLVEQLEGFDASKSEVMREALREYLGATNRTASRSAGSQPSEAEADTESIDELIAERVDTIVTDRLERPARRPRPRDVNVNITLDGATGSVDPESDDRTPASDDTADGVSHEPESRKTDGEERENADPTERKTCAQCGDELDASHVYCPNCGEKASRRVFCDCGDELRSDWGFCPGCGRRTPAADVLDSS